MKMIFNMPFELSDAQRAALRTVCPRHEIVVCNQADPDKLDGNDAEILITEPVPRKLEAWPKLRWVQLLSAGSNHLRGHPIWETAVVVSNASGTHGVPIAQYITLVWLMMMHRALQLMEFKLSRTWPNRAALSGCVVRGMTVGIIGYGAIGRECARQLDAMGMKVLCLKRDPASREHHGNNPWPGTGDPLGIIPSEWYSPAQLAEFLPQCDLVVITVPSTAQTEELIASAELALMKPGSHLIVVSRGGIVSETALSDALRSGHLSGAAVDCYVNEPVSSDHPFFALPNLIMTPHMAGVFNDYWPVLFRLVMGNMQRFSTGSPLLNEVSRSHGY